MKLLAIGDAQRIQKYLPDLPIVGQVELMCVGRGTPDADILATAADADFLLADAVSPVSEDLIAGMPNLKLVHSEGVAFDKIDLEAARARDIYVCNNAGANAAAVAEQTILLMLACLKFARTGDAAVRDGEQIVMKERLMLEGIRELGDCTVGLVGLGAIGTQVARRLAAWDCPLRYFNRSRRSSEVEEDLGVAYVPLEQLAAECDIVSLHVPVTPDTENLVDVAFLARMKDDAILINTARGELVDQHALAATLEAGKLAGVGFDTLSPEPVQIDHPLLNLSPEATARTFFSPHIAGVTEGMFKRAHHMVWSNIARVVAGETPLNIVS